MLGQVIHGYRVDRVLSADKGGFGEVFLATHVESGAEAVVKVLRAEMSANRDTVTRFFNEARAAASIHHPGIVQIHNVGYHGDRAYLLMERLRGEDLETRLKAGRLPLDRALLFMRQTAGVIAAAHERGIVHRDLKPANLFIVQDPDVAGGERVRVLDFGIAKLGADARPAGATTGVFGTPMYMSPEQCASTGDVDHRSDLYSLGCIFYELVCGYPPFGRGGTELIAAHLRDRPTPPRDVVANVPPAIDALILSLLEKAPERRMQSCAALVNALDGAAATSGIILSTARSFQPATGGGYTTAPSAPTAAETPSAKRSSSGGGGKTIVIVVGAVVAAAAVAVIVIATRGGGSSTTSTPAKTPPTPPTPPIDARVVVTETPDAAAPPPDAAPPRDDSAQRAIADAAIEKGKAAMYAQPPRLDEAIADFRDAVAADPTATAYFDLGVADYMAGHFGEALAALRAVRDHQPTEALQKKVDSMIEKVEADMPKRD
jgi:tRNA A-37 threonylcarbamoyl transferase component Bud32